jgi:hypothetical protein
VTAAIAARRRRHDAADQAGPAGGGDAVDVGEAQTGAPHRLGDQAVEMVEMAAGGDLRHDAAIGAMLGDLRSTRSARMRRSPRPPRLPSRRSSFRCRG